MLCRGETTGGRSDAEQKNVPMLGMPPPTAIVVRAAQRTLSMTAPMTTQRPEMPETTVLMLMPPQATNALGTMIASVLSGGYTRRAEALCVQVPDPPIPLLVCSSALAEPLGASETTDPSAPSRVAGGPIWLLF